jgi:hypothetical protein
MTPTIFPVSPRRIACTAGTPKGAPIILSTGASLSPHRISPVLIAEIPI